MAIENQNDLEALISSFETLSYPQLQIQPGETSYPMNQDLIVDIYLKGSIGQVLSERWNFSLSLDDSSKQSAK
jgi:hypothetical protein